MGMWVKTYPNMSMYIGPPMFLTEVFTLQWINVLLEARS